MARPKKRWARLFTRAQIPAGGPRRSRTVGRRQGRRLDGVDRRLDSLPTAVASAARIQPAREAAIPGARNRNRILWSNHSDPDSRADGPSLGCGAATGGWIVATFRSWGKGASASASAVRCAVSNHELHQRLDDRFHEAGIEKPASME